MGLFSFLKRLLFAGAAPTETAPDPFISSPHRGTPRAHDSPPADSAADGGTVAVLEKRSTSSKRKTRRTPKRTGPSPRLQPLLYQSSLIKTPSSKETVDEKPYRFAIPAGLGQKFLDLSQDGDQRWLDYYGLPPLSTPDELAGWLGIPIGKLAWLANRTYEGRRPPGVEQSHYFYKFLQKRKRGYRLIEAPKAELARVQERILREILDNVPAHPAAHGFVHGRSILTNARPHVGKRFILKIDLEDFYPSVRYSRVVAIFRSLGFSREVSLWLAQLTTTAIPWNLNLPDDSQFVRWEFMSRYHPRHLPQGAATSPALANLSAYALDVRLMGLAQAYHLTYTRYADDLTFSGEGRNIPALREFIPLTTQIIKSERFRVNRAKRKVVRSNQRQSVTGVVVNEKVNVSRREYDRLKAVLTNCIRQGPSTQNRIRHPDFPSHLRGRIAHVMQLNPARGEKLLALYQRIDWRK